MSGSHPHHPLPEDVVTKDPLDIRSGRAATSSDTSLSMFIGDWRQTSDVELSSPGLIRSMEISDGNRNTW
jgi:hypothetical protein